MPGLLAAFLALFGWGFGDFSIQRSVRRVGTFVTIACIGAIGTVGLLPFVWRDVHLLTADLSRLWLILLAGFLAWAISVLDFEALRLGKISVVEPIFSFEIIFTVGISLLFLGEHLTAWQLLIVAIAFMGILLTVTRREHARWWNRWRRRNVIEQGALLAGASALLFAISNVLVALASRATTPLLSQWAIHLVLFVFGTIALLVRGKSDVRVNVVRSWKLLLIVGILDVGAWVAYATAVVRLPIALTIGITEGYVVLASLLGVTFGKERLLWYQYVGVGMTLLSVIALAITIGG